MLETFIKFQILFKGLMEIKEKQSLKAFNSWRVGGEADYFCLPESVADLMKALKWADEKKVEVTYLGGGSNVLISDKGIRGLVICFKKFVGIEDLSTETHVKYQVKAGTLKQKLMRKFLKESLPPALFLSGLPGDVAGGVVMNAGVSEKDVEPKEFVSIVESFKVLEKNAECEYQEKTYQHKDVDWLYRKTKGWGPGAITEVVFSYPKKDRVEDLKEQVRAAQELRSSKQPLNLPSCGSVFRNPKDDKANPESFSAGYFIEKAGLKGYQYGDAEISRKHANFITNQGEARALDIHCAICIAKNKVKELFDVDLQTEVKYIGDWQGVI